MAINRSIWIALPAGILLLMSSALILGFPFRIYRGVSPSQMRAKVEADLAIGSDIASVLTYLDENGIEHARYSKEHHDIGAIKRNVCHVLLVECSIDIRFYFNDAARLQRISVNEGFTGL